MTDKMIRQTILLVVGLGLTFGSDVLVLEDSNFDQEIRQNEVILVKFYAPWCGHCKRLAPEYDTAAAALKKNDPPVVLAKVDCTEGGKDVCSKHGVSGYPTLKFFKGGEPQDYNGPRDSAGIVSFMKKKAGPTSKTITSEAQMDKFLSHEDHGVVGFFSEAGNSLSKTFSQTANSLSDNFRFAHTSEKALLEKYGFSDDVVIFQPKRLQNKFEDKSAKHDGDDTVDNLKTWINANVHGLCGHRTQANMGQFEKPQVVAFYNVDYMKDPKGSNYWRNRVMKVAKGLKEGGLKMTFAVSSRSEFSQELSEFGVTDSGDKPLVCARNAQDEKFVMAGDFSMDALKAFVQDLEAGKLEPYMKSEALPEDNSGPVKTVVAKNFNDIVNDEDRDVLIEFYAPWCGHCKTLAPKFDELGEKLAKESGITIAKMDATANDVPGQYAVSGFPTLYFAPRGSKMTPKKYEGGREVDDFVKYLAREATEELSGFDREGGKKKQEKEL